MSRKNELKLKKRQTVQYDRWGYFFIAPFFIIYIIFSLIPFVSTFVSCFFENYRDGLTIVGPNRTISAYGIKEDKDTVNDLIKNADDSLNQIADDFGPDKTISDDFINSINATLAQSPFYSELNEPDLFTKTVNDTINANKGKTARQLVDSLEPIIGKKEAAFTYNFRTVFKSDILKYTWNTIIMWVIGFIPQILVALLLSVWFSNTELRLRCQQFFKTVIYMPNLIMAAAFAMLFFTLFSDQGPINSILLSFGWIGKPIRYMIYTSWTRVLVAGMNFLMWYGNTTILLMAGIMGIDESLFEAARIDGASPLQIFFKITMPLLLPIFVYVLITSLIGGIQMFDVPQILTNGNGTPNRSSMTLIMFLNKHLANKNYGVAGAVSVLTFIVTAILSSFVYMLTMSKYSNKREGAK
jgi:cellobiose transport system permease protein